jgi:hypothetical protein
MKTSRLLMPTVLYCTEETKVEFIKLRSHSDIQSAARCVKLAKNGNVQQINVIHLFLFYRYTMNQIL